MENIISIKNICCSFGKKEVLHNINIDIQKGTIFGLLGPSGSGKTTLINIITGQLKNSSGESTIFGVNSLKLSGNDYKKIGIMMDDFGLYERMNCYDNLKFYQMIDGNDSKEINKVLDKVGLLPSKKIAFSNLSKGMKNRLAFARAILRSPKILFLDEPTSGLDPQTMEAIHNMILKEKEKGTTIFLTTHNMHEAEKLCDNIALLNDGKIVEYGNPIDLCRKYNNIRKLNVHLKDGQNICLDYSKESGETIKRYIENSQLETIHSTEPNLETIFMNLTGKEMDI